MDGPREEQRNLTSHISKKKKRKISRITTKVYKRGLVKPVMRINGGSSI